MVGGVLVEKDVEKIKKDMDLQIVNIKQTLETVQKTLKTQEQAIKEMEREYSMLIGNNKNQKGQVSESKSSNKGGVLA